ncbi:enoyl-CoA hydratase/isomerase family protein [Arthrobacter mobilis]|uniref:Enoyl-CoA hydratase/isomerase family protein n=1 Tax=Arthrobacter mobilis TaxID=2724944 RepID=A0A7X6HF18_9MICC|nr:enoyl-CoA hydratase/isomerase family protein [Arthrobacter mobilis]NKX55886.1 enoyl-CoA hydratase/isomerase family protein [Arthrobacter mobilis]
MTAGFETLEFALRDGIAWLTLDRPDAANALNQQLADEFCQALALAEADQDCHVVVLAGNGRFFCAGGDVAAMAQTPERGAFVARLAGTMHQGLLRLARSSLVSIAAVHGPAAGAGLGLVLNADFAVASPQASFIGAYAGAGLSPDCGVSYLLPRAVGPRRATTVLLGGRPVGAQEALEWGLVGEIAGDGFLEQRVRELAETLASSPVQALGPTKRLLTAEAVNGYEAHLRLEQEQIAALSEHRDTAERLASFAARSQRLKTAVTD